ncbi:MAG: 7,8-didemethyl-8-hydroxy-5-deazariboflavin synthase [Gammaproteobacteria bacterium]|nr:7,8-didemethyl-8-hydroxy-5-deazariboflavin synthase [Gammaproteobacteria bacterium]OUT95953.1 MAG: 7,8-didemethyl-8-hydroxy-5-deazariboflavin synthase [Gammaproteobacteria bacterium TMED36]
MSKQELDHYISLLNSHELDDLMEKAKEIRGDNKKVITYSKKVFIPLTELCLDVCHYCTFAKAPKKLDAPYLEPDQVLAIAEQGKAQFVKEALFTLGEKPEMRYQVAKDHLQKLGFETTIEYLGSMSKLVYEETGLLPHLNPGNMTLLEMEKLREYSVSMGIMLESSSERLCGKGGPHFGSPDKQPATRLQTMKNAGKLRIPITTGILIGIGETIEERIQSLLDIKNLHREYGHIQEVIIQNFIPKENTRMKKHSPASKEDLLWTLSAARIIFGKDMNIQCPPNLNSDYLDQILDCGINDWGGVSPITIDHVNPESPWPQIEQLEKITNNKGMELVERLAIYPEYIEDQSWYDKNLHSGILELSDSSRYGRHDQWRCGESLSIPASGKHDLWVNKKSGDVSDEIKKILDKSIHGFDLDHDEITKLFHTRGDDYHLVLNHADRLRQKINGDEVTYVITRNINYTNICKYSCHFCAFSKGKTKENLRGKPYLINNDEVADRALEAWSKGAHEVCLQGGIHPHYDGYTYIDICKAIKERVPEIHIHAFSPLEVTHGASSLGLPIDEYLQKLKEAGLSTMPGTAAEILDDAVRENICPDKLTSEEWINVIKTAHRVGIKTTSTIMFGHTEQPADWSTHLIKLRDLQKETGGITEFIPLPYVSMESPMYKRGNSRPGPTFNEVLLMHAVSRIALNPHIKNIQASWVKLGKEGALSCLNAGVNDMGGTLMNESISRAAGSIHGQEFEANRMEEFIRNSERRPQLRNTTYEPIQSRINSEISYDLSMAYMQTFMDSAHPVV